MTQLRLLACQIEIPATRTGRQRDEHIERCASAIRRRLEGETADLVILPELSSIEYSREAFDRLDQLAEPLDGPSFELYREQAIRFGVTIVYGIARTAGDAYAITQAAVGPDGLLLGHYDKLHIAQFGASMEKEYFVPGGHLFVLDIKGVRVAPMICYDIRFPELARILRIDHGVSLILHCGAYYRDESFPTWHAFVTTRALENQCWILSLNRAGKHFGHSVLCPPWVDDDHPTRSFPEQDEECALLDIDTAAIQAAGELFPFLGDRRDGYEELECAIAAAHYT